MTTIGKSENVVPLPLAERAHTADPSAETGDFIDHLAFQALHLPNTLSKSQIEQLGLYILQLPLRKQIPESG